MLSQGCIWSSVITSAVGCYPRLWKSVGCYRKQRICFNQSVDLIMFAPLCSGTFSVPIHIPQTVVWSVSLPRSALLLLSAYPFTSCKQSFGRSALPRSALLMFGPLHSALLYPALLCPAQIMLCSGTFSVPIVVWPLCSALPRSGTFSVPIHIPQTVYHSFVKIFIYLFLFQNNK